jgi:hypothetical protein
MDRYWEANSSTQPPTTPAGTAGGYPTDGNLAAAIAPTTPGAWWYYAISEELRNAIVTLGVAPDYSQVNQLGGAIQAALTHVSHSIDYNDLINKPDLAKVATSGSYTDLSNKPAIQPPLGFTPVQQGTGIGQQNNTVKLGWGNGRLLATVDSLDLGQFVFEAELSADVTNLQNLINGKQPTGNYAKGADTHAYALGWNGARAQLYVDGSGQGDIYTSNWYSPMTLYGVGSYTQAVIAASPGNIVNIGLPGTWMCMGPGLGGGGNDHLFVRTA